MDTESRLRHFTRCVLSHFPSLYDGPIEKVLQRVSTLETKLSIARMEVSTLKRGLTAKRVEIATLKRQNAELVALAARDPLTGLVNRYALALQFETTYGGLTRKLNETRRAVHVSGVMLDLDHFKEVNDRYGHAAGDQVLVEMARRIKQHLGRRQEDSLARIHARIGGEEFLVIMPHADSEHAFKQAATRLLYEVRKTPFVVTVNGREVAIPLTVSAGIATLELTPENIGWSSDQQLQKLYEQADLALYAAKNPDPPDRGDHPGRDRTIRYDTLEPVKA